jgi:hypothetical protein
MSAELRLSELGIDMPPRMVTEESDAALPAVALGRASDAADAPRPV